MLETLGLGLIGTIFIVIAAIVFVFVMIKVCFVVFQMVFQVMYAVIITLVMLGIVWFLITIGNKLLGQG